MERVECPECGEPFDPRGLPGHRAMSHGISRQEQHAGDGAPADEAEGSGGSSGVLALLAAAAAAVVGAVVFGRSP